ncbi:tyrosyl-DNA phosphodiesterase 2-like isoform X2 [Frankliniella occidentalis]|uniref:Tyrosyl-DNA phosphodiesterase 2 n=1 Tax=Frankliniella occidentalis TaxID=133901 RepID=A0A6J1S4M5_FRAOC|nr:tyrosyl-DNA phosphodiesterase 2-like isoform X2 [Frankliniella occidentalis]
MIPSSLSVCLPITIRAIICSASGGAETSIMSDDEDIPDVTICQQRVEEFAQITGTDEACAQFYLQDRKWDLERSINAFFEAKASGGVNLMEDHDSEAPVVVVNIDQAVANQLAAVPPVALPLPKQAIRPLSHKHLQCSTKPPPEMTFITWNIDGLNSHNLKKRTKAVCVVIFESSPDVVFLQEVIPSTLSYIENKLPEYKCIASGDGEYFTATLLRRFTTYYDSHRVVDFPGSLMGRSLLVTEAHIGPLKLTLLNTHLESTADHAAERVNQLNKSLKEVTDAAKNRVVIFGGDLNLRDKELVLCGGLPNGVVDLWEAGGSRPECRYTWDMTRNTNTEMAGRFKPRCRFDRVYLRQSFPPAVKPKYFGLIGLQKVMGTQSFPSDHWGIKVHFDILDQDDSASSPAKKMKLETTVE